MSEGLACEDVRQVHLRNGEPRRGQGVAQRDAGVRQAGRIDQDRVGGRPRLLDPVDQCALVVRLERLDLAAELLGELLERGVDLGERGVAVDLGLARAEQIEVGPVQDHDAQRVADTAASLLGDSSQPAFS